MSLAVFGRRHIYSMTDSWTAQEWVAPVLVEKASRETGSMQESILLGKNPI